MVLFVDVLASAAVITIEGSGVGFLHSCLGACDDAGQLLLDLCKGVLPFLFDLCSNCVLDFNSAGLAGITNCGELRISIRFPVFHEL